MASGGVEPDHVSFLPGLDPGAHGVEGTRLVPGPHGDALSDRNGNAGPTVWLDGRVVGAWAQRPDGQVVFRLLEDLSAEARRRVSEEEEEALTAWMDGDVANPRFRTPLERELSG